jgi:inner membrane protein YidH
VSPGPSDYLAAERTFLAWIRTGLALMGFGFVVARFGLFLSALQISQHNLPVQSYGLSFWFGTTLIVLGVVVNVCSARHHVRLVRSLKQGGSEFDRPSSLALAVAIILAVVGLAMAIYLISVGEPKKERLTLSDHGASDAAYAPIATMSSGVNLATASFISTVHGPMRTPLCMSYNCRTR